MSGPRRRLEELGFELPQAPAPLAAYVPAVTSGSLVFISGQGPVKDGTPIFTGRVGSDRTLDEGQQAAQTACLNALAVLEKEIGSLDRVVRIVKLLGWVSSAPEFTDQPQVMNGASQLLETVFGERGKHARSAVSAHVLPMNITVELEMIVEVKLD